MKKSIGWKLFLQWQVAVIFLFVLAGCGGAASSVKNASVVPGVFMDSHVEGLSYETPTCKGVTKIGGFFEYRAGETITFSIGELVLGTAAGKPVVTPVDIVKGAGGAGDRRVVNICVLLQTLDEDGNLANGIVITPRVASIVSRYGKSIQFDQDVLTFSFDGALRTVMSELNYANAFGDTPRAVVTAGAAQKHLENSLSRMAAIKKNKRNHFQGE